VGELEGGRSRCRAKKEKPGTCHDPKLHLKNKTKFSADCKLRVVNLSLALTVWVGLSRPMLHDLIHSWFHWVEQGGYWAIVLLMAMESSIFPVPSEVVMPPAAILAAQGKMSLWGVIAAGTFGSWLGSAITYGVARGLEQVFFQNGESSSSSPRKRSSGRSTSCIATRRAEFSSPDCSPWCATSSRFPPEFSGWVSAYSA